MNLKRSKCFIAAAGLIVAAALTAIRAADSPGLSALETFTIPSSHTSVRKSDGTVNINTAGLNELMTLEEIGEKKALAIIEYRSRNGRFYSADELALVEGVGQAAVEKNRSRITV